MLINHTGLVNCLFAVKDLFGLDYNDRCLALTTLTFDISVLEYYLPWITGGQVVLATDKQRKDPQKIIHFQQVYLKVMLILIQ